MHAQVEEETGFDLTGMINKKDSIVTQVNAQTITMFIVKGIDEGTVFETQTRKEIGVSCRVYVNCLSAHFLPGH